MLENAGWPALEVQTVRLRYRAPTLFVESAMLHQGRTGSLAVEGEVRLGEELDLTIKAERLPVDLLLSADWKQHVRGTVAGETHVRTPLPTAGPPALAGSWALTDGRLEALPILDQLALFTNTAQFRQLPLTRASGDFRLNGGRLDLTHVIAESAGLARVEGACTLQRRDGRRRVSARRRAESPAMAPRRARTGLCQQPRWVSMDDSEARWPGGASARRPNGAARRGRGGGSDRYDFASAGGDQAKSRRCGERACWIYSSGSKVVRPAL